MRIGAPCEAHCHTTKVFQLLAMSRVQNGLCDASLVGAFVLGDENSVAPHGDKPIIPGNLPDTFVARRGVLVGPADDETILLAKSNQRAKYAPLPGGGAKVGMIEPKVAAKIFQLPCVGG